MEVLVPFVPAVSIDAHLKFFDKLAKQPCQNITFLKAFASLFFKLSDINGSLKAVPPFCLRCFH